MKLTLCMPIAEVRGGAEGLLLHLLNRARQASLDLSIVFLEDGPMVNRARKEGIHAVVLKAGRLRDLHRLPRVVRGIIIEVRRHDADAIVSWMTKAHLYAGLAAPFTGRPVLWYQHGVPSGRDLTTRLATLLPADGVLACSETIARAQEQLWPHRRTRCVHPCVDLDRFDADKLPSQKEVRRKADLPVDVPVVGMVARMQRWKGVHVFVEAMAHVVQKHPDVRGVIIGGRHDLEPDYPVFVEKRISDLGLRHHVSWVGFQSNVSHWMQAMDVIVHASDHEPFGMVILESMALGKPTVAGASGGPLEIITDGLNGLLAPYGNAVALSRSILRYIEDPSFAKSIGQAAKRRASNFSSDHYALQFRDAVRSQIPVSAQSMLNSSVSVV